MTSHDMCAVCKSLNVLQDLRSSRNLCVQAWWLVGREGGVCVWLQKCNPSERYESYENSRRKVLVGARSFYILDRFEQRQTYSSGNTRRTEAIASKCIKYIQIPTIPCPSKSLRCAGHEEGWMLGPSPQDADEAIETIENEQGSRAPLSILSRSHIVCKVVQTSMWLRFIRSMAVVVCVCVCWDWMCKLQVFHCLICCDFGWDYFQFAFYSVEHRSHTVL